MRLRYIIGFGIEQAAGGRDTGLGENDVRRIAREAATQHKLPGYTLSFGLGAWFDGDRVIEERCGTVVVYGEEADRLAVLAFAEHLRAALSQATILYAEEVSAAEILDASALAKRYVRAEAAIAE